VDIKASIRNKLIAGAGVLVGSRVYSYRAPSDLEKSCIVFGQSGDDEYWRNLATAGVVVNSTWQVDIYADSWLTCHNVADAVKTTIDFAGPATWNGVKNEIHKMRRMYVSSL
jgi:hypothetical protein